MTGDSQEPSYWDELQGATIGAQKLGRVENVLW